MIEIFFPRSMAKSEEFILYLVEAQNDGLNTPNWRFMWSSEERFEKLLALCIDKNSFRRLEDMGFETFYRFGKMSVNAGREA